ncbi:MAG: acetyl-CoA carboxylase biotin carboxyl carrier protein [Sphingomonas bacterium]|nr:acetyl-CoA carboxylase biotin carboxyl carrier protein [Sphingomonas bacterium]
MADQPEGHEMRVDSALLRELAELLSANDLTEIEVEDGDRKIRVRREAADKGQAAFIAAIQSAQQMQSNAPATFAAPAAAMTAPAADPAPAAAVDAIKSPMVGTVFLSPEPGAKPFIAAGQKVAIGETLLIVEAMKVMNPILSTKAGTVRQILVADAQPIEYDQPLVVID